MNQTQTEIPKVNVSQESLVVNETVKLAPQEAFDRFAGVGDVPTPWDSKYLETDRVKLLSEGSRVGDAVRRGNVAVTHLLDVTNPFVSGRTKNSPEEVARRRKETIQGHLNNGL